MTTDEQIAILIETLEGVDPGHSAIRTGREFLANRHARYRYTNEDIDVKSRLMSALWKAGIRD